MNAKVVLGLNKAKQLGLSDVRRQMSGVSYKVSIVPCHKIHMSGNSQGVKRPYLGHTIILCNTLL